MEHSDIEHMAHGYPPAHIGKDCEEVIVWLATQLLATQKQRDALASESASMMALAIACEKEFGSYTAEEFPDDAKVSHPEERCNITFGMIRQALNKTATDAYLNSVRAEGVESFVNGGCTYEIPHRIKNLALSFAAQLRAGEPS